MKGIPVLPNGDPLTLTYVFAGSYQIFDSWCHFSWINRNSGRVHPIVHAQNNVLRGVRSCDFVFTWNYDQIPNWWQLRERITYIENNPHYQGRSYYQMEPANIEPNIIEC